MKYTRMKFILSAFSVYAILLSLPTLHAQAATETVEIDDYTYTITDGTAVLSGYDGTETDVIIPTSVDYEGQVYRIRTIGEFAFEGNQHMQTLVIPEEIVKLERGAFKNCTFLRSITINGDLGDCNDRSLSTDRLFQEAAYPWYSVFYNVGANADSLTVSFGEGVTYIPAYLFATAAAESDGDYPHVTSIELSGTVTEIGKYAFYDCHDLQSVTMADGIIDIDSYAFYGCNHLKSVEWGENLTSIGNQAFFGNTSLPSIHFPDRLVLIDEFAFEECTRLEEIVLPASVSSLENGAFKNCTRLRSITIDGNLEDCDSSSASTGNAYMNSAYPWYSVFYNAGANTSGLAVTFGEGVTRIPAYLFATAATETDNDFVHITSVNLPATVTAIGEYAFYNCHDLAEVYYSGADRDWDIILVGENNERLIEAYISEELSVPAAEDVTDQTELSETVETDENAEGDATDFGGIIGFFLDYLEKIRSWIVEIIRAFI